jgi:hypothetical protein
MERELRVPKAELEFTLQPISTNCTEVAPGSNVIGEDFQGELIHDAKVYISGRPGMLQPSLTRLDGV